MTQTNPNQSSLSNSPDQTGSTEELSRRAFLGNSCTLGIGATLAASSQSLLGQQPNTKPLQIAIIGCGRQGEALRQAISKIEGVRFAAVCDIQKYAAGAMYGRIRATRRGVGEEGKSCTRYLNAKEMFAQEKDLDAVLIATPDYVHHTYTRMAAEAGCHVYCESLMSNTIEHAADMVRTQREHGVLIQIGHECRSDPRYLHAKNRILDEAKLLGWITNAYGQWHRALTACGPRPLPKKLRLYPNDEILTANGYQPGVKGMFELMNWRMFKKFGSGQLSDLGSQQLDIFNWFFDTLPKSIYATGGIDFRSAEYVTKLLRDWVTQDAELAAAEGNKPTIDEKIAQAINEMEFAYEHADSLMVILEYATPRAKWGTEAGSGDPLTSRAYYEVLTTNKSGAFYERFMGEFGTLTLSQTERAYDVESESHVDREQWHQATQGDKPIVSIVDARERELNYGRFGPPPVTYKIPMTNDEPPHTPHLRNFFTTIINGGKQSDLNCPVEIAYRSTVSILKVHESLGIGTKIELSPADYELPK